MAFVPDPVVILNLLLCIIILIMGCAIYGKRRDVNALMIGIAFGLFGHLHRHVAVTMRSPSATMLSAVFSAPNRSPRAESQRFVLVIPMGRGIPVQTCSIP